MFGCDDFLNFNTQVSRKGFISVGFGDKKKKNTERAF